MKRSPQTRPAPRPKPDSGARSAYLGADRVGTEFWLSGAHVFSLSGDGARLRHVCALARFNRRSRSLGRDAAAEGFLAVRSYP